MSDVRLNLWLPQSEYDRIQALAEQEKRSVASMARYLLNLGCDAFEKSQTVGLAPSVAVGAIATVLGGLVAPFGVAGAVAGAAGATGAAVAAALRKRREKTHARSAATPADVPSVSVAQKTKPKKFRRMIP